jgi:hypothetical protein
MLIPLRAGGLNTALGLIRSGNVFRGADTMARMGSIKAGRCIRREVAVLFFSAACTLSACSPGSGRSGARAETAKGLQSGATAQRATSPAAQSHPGGVPTRGSKGEICGLMPLGDVAAIVAPALATQTHKKGEPAPSEHPDYSMCHYDFPGEPRVQAGIELVDFDTPEKARTTFQAEREMNARRTDVIHDLSELAGIGDTAFTADDWANFSAGVSVLHGPHTLRAIVGVDETPYSFRLPMARTLASEMLKRRP